MNKAVKHILSYLLLGVGFASVGISSNAEDTNYYKNVDTSTGQKLMESLTSTISSGFTGVSYDGLWDAYAKTDCKPGTNIIWDMYSDEEYECNGSKKGKNYSKEGDSYNREHSIPQSWFKEASPMKSDLFHVYPTDGYVNNRRSNYPYGEVGSATYTSKNGSKLGSSSFSGYSGTVFEPVDEYKGDFARSYFYMAARYNNRSLTNGNGSSTFKSTYPYLTDYAAALFTKWSHEDPVSTKEIERNEAVYKIQNNRNPFIDHPEYIDQIWENEYDDTLTVDTTKVNNVISKINTIGTVTLDSEALITECKTLYNALNYKEKKEVTNYQTLSTAEDTLASLKAPVDPVTPVTPSTDKTAHVYNIDFKAFAYKKDVTLTIDGDSFKLNAAGAYSDTTKGTYETRMGGNKNNSVLGSSKFNHSDVYCAELLMDFDAKDITGFEVEHTTEYQVAGYEIYFSEDGGDSYYLVKAVEGTSSKGTYAGYLPEKKTGRFALVLYGTVDGTTYTYPRSAISKISTISGKTEDIEIPTETINVSGVQTKLSLDVNYVLDSNGNVKSASANVIASAKLSKVYETASYYVLYVKKSSLTKSINELYTTGDINTFANTIGAEYYEVDPTADGSLYKNLGVSFNEEYTVVFVLQSEEKLYFTGALTYSVKGMIECYLDNNMIADSTQVKVLEYIKNN